MAILRDENTQWNVRGGTPSWKVALYATLSILKAVGTGLLLCAWLIIGTTLASAYYPGFLTLKSLTWNYWWIFLIIVVLFDSIKNLKEIK